MFLLVAIVVIGILTLITKINKRYQYWRTKGIKYYPPKFLFGCLKPFTFAEKAFVEVISDIYFKHKNEPYVGYYLGVKPVLMLRDPVLIKQVLCENFELFDSRGIVINDADYLSDNLLFMAGERWKLTRQSLVSFFTPKKLKHMLPIIAQCGEKLNLSILNDLKLRSSDLWTLTANYTSNVIAACAFGIDTKTLTDENTPFREIGRNIFDDGYRFNLIITMDSILPFMFQLLKINRFRNVDNFFYDIFKDALHKREVSGELREDFIDLCLKLKKQKVLREPNSSYTIEVTDKYLTAQAFFFFIAGHETTANAITFALYELAHNSKILEKVHREIDTLLVKFKDNLYECLEHSTYIGYVIDETLRKYPPIGNLQRVSSRPFKIPGTNITIDKDVMYHIPVFAIHRNPIFYPEPNKFKPERFEKKQELNGIYLPFGDGQRSCIGKRLALLKVKMSVFSVLKDFTVKGLKPYEEDLKLKPIFLTVKAQNMDIEFELRK